MSISGEVNATVVLTLHWAEPHLPAAVPMMAVENFPGDGDPNKFAWPLAADTSKVSTAYTSYGIEVSGTEKASINTWHRRYSWSLTLTTKGVPSGQMSVRYMVTNRIDPSYLEEYDCRGTLQ
jgi:hypothetical protein